MTTRLSHGSATQGSVDCAGLGNTLEIPMAGVKLMSDRAQTSPITELFTPLEGQQGCVDNLAPHVRAEALSGQVGDRTPNVPWQKMTTKLNFSNSDLRQLLDHGLKITGETTPLVADDKKLPGSEIHDAIRNAVHDMKHYAEKIRTVGNLHEIPNAATGVKSAFESVLNDRDRNNGEFQWAIGEKDGKLFLSPGRFTPPVGRLIGYELHASKTVDMGLGYRIIGVIHTHPNEKDMDTEHFSEIDIDQADALRGNNPNIILRSYLLTPDNRILVYTPKEKHEHPNGEEAGFFLKNGVFVLTNERFGDFTASRL
jgi:hypothetical protein